MCRDRITKPIMSKLFANVTRWIWNKLIVLMLIVLMLLAGNWFRSEWNGISIQLKQAAEIEDQIERARNELEELNKKAKEFGADAREKIEELNSAEKITAAAWDEANEAKNQYDSASNQVGWYQKAFDQEKVKQMGAAWANFQAKLAAAKVAEKTSDLLREAQENSPWVEHQNSITATQSEIERLESTRNELLGNAGKTPTQRLVIAIRDVLPTAIWTLLGIILAPVFIKAILYFGVAPLISRTKPVVVIPDSGGDVEVGPSAVSVPILLAPGDELIVHSDYLQAAGVGPGKRTRWIFSWSMPFTSVAAGLYMMVAVRNRENDDTKVTVSPKKDLFDMISDVRIPKGSSMVIYPRSLVGIVMKNGISPHITRHWRIASLHSWVTFQFRYIVIHGESRILMKGCRGIRAERVEISKPSMQDQLATLGFTANLAYSGIRCETFIDYLLGRDELFNDRFSDANGFQFTEEVPNPDRKSGIFGRGLEGLIDGFLKAFGI